MTTVTLKQQEFKVAGTFTFTFPAGVYWVWASGIGGGGGGSSAGGGGGQSITGGGGGGGAGESLQNGMIYGVPGSNMTVIIGAGGAAGSLFVTATNVRVGPEGNTAANAGWGGGDTWIGPRRLMGGFGSGNPDGGAAAMGGGPGAWHSTISLCDAGDRIGSGTLVATSPGIRPGRPRDSVRYVAGSGGASAPLGHSSQFNGSDGAPCGPFLGGQGGTGIGTNSVGGGGGAASVYGPGGAGGSFPGDAPPAPSTSYGAGGGGSSGYNGSSSGSPVTKFHGAAGVDGYALLSWLEVT